MKEGWNMAVGDKISYVITTGVGRLYEKAKPYVLSSYTEVDIGYHITNQIVPAATRILTLFGIDENVFLPAKEAKSLLDFED